jgi:hypothetical protein
MKLMTPGRVALMVSMVAVLGVVDVRPVAAQVMVDTLLPPAVLTSQLPATIDAPTFAVEASARPAPLVGLYISMATLQALDFASTRKALNAGAVEGNPLVAPLLDSPTALLALKAGVTGATIYVSERLWKRNRVAAVMTMIGLNTAYGVVVAHNYGVAARQRR